MGAKAHNLLDAVLDHGRAVVAAGVLLIGAGLIVLDDIAREAQPDIELGIFHVTLPTSRLSPQDGDRLVARPLTDGLRGLQGLDQVRTTSRAGSVHLEVEFDPDADPARARTRLLERLEPLRAKLPAGVSLPRVRQVNLSTLPLTAVTVAGDLPAGELMGYARTLLDTLEGMPEVREAVLIGEREDIVEVVLDPSALEAYGLGLSELRQVVGSANRALPGGRSESTHSHLSLGVSGLLDSVEALARLPIRTSDQAVVRLGDIALIRRTLDDPASLARVDAAPALAIAIRKHPGVNVFDALERVRQVVDQTTAKWPRAVAVGYTQDASRRIRTRTGELTNALAGAVVAVLVIVVATLGPRAAVLVGLAIPASFLLAIMALAAGGLSINTAVLYAFVMSVGLLVDGAIVVVERAERDIAGGRSPDLAYRTSAIALARPLFTATVTTLVAFVPLLFWPGVVGKYLYFLPLTIWATLSASLVLALVFVPVLGRLGPKVSRGRSAPAEPQYPRSTRDPPIASPVPGYARALEVALASPGITLAVGLAMLIASIWAFQRYGDGVEHLPDIEPFGAEIHVHAPDLGALADRHRIALGIETAVRGHAAVASVLTIVGEHAVRSSDGGGAIATLHVELVPWQTRPGAQTVLAEIEARVEAALGTDPMGTHTLTGVTAEVRPLGEGPRTPRAIALDVSGTDHRSLDIAVHQARAALSSIPGVVRVQDSRPGQHLAWSLAPERDALARLRLPLEHVGQMADLITGGVKLGTLRRPTSAEEDLDIRVRLPERARSVHALDELYIHHRGHPIPLGQVARLEPRLSPNTVERIDGRLARQVVADVQAHLPEDQRLADILAQIEAWALATALPPGTAVERRGADDDPERTREFVLQAFAGALLLITIVLLIQFKSVFDTALVLFAVVSAIAGVLLGLLVIDRPFSIVLSGIGIIALAGIVVNSNIILVASYRSYLADGLGALEAVRAAAHARFRPIVLTTATTVAGLAPLLLGLDIDLAERQVTAGAPTAAYWLQMSAAIAFGLVSASLLTLFVTPAALVFRARLDAARARFAEAERARGVPESIAAVFATHGHAVGFAGASAIVAAWIFIPALITVRITDIFSKQLFEQPPSRWFQALEWAGFWSLIVLGAAYAYWKNAHVRVDIVRERLSARAKAWLEIIGFFLLLAPTALVVLLAGQDLVLRSYLDEEISGALLGSPTRWIFKAMMLLCFFQLLWLGGYVTWHNIRFLTGREREIYPPENAPRDEAENPPHARPRS